MTSLTIVIPAKNEADSLQRLLPEIKKRHSDAEIIVVNDGSSDDTTRVCRACSVKEIVHPYTKGNGAAIKTGARAASGDVLLFMDADGQHSPEDISKLVGKVEQGFDMVVGARNRGSQASVGRGVANSLYNKLASYITGQKVEDLTSGFRAVCREKFLEFLYLLPNGFSYPTTSTMAFFRAGYSVAYLSIVARSRDGVSHIKPIKDGIRFLLIIFKIGTLYSPLKIFFPMAFLVFGLGLIRYFHTYIAYGSFTNMSATLFVASAQIFLIGLVSEQITSLMYKDRK